MIFAVTGKGEQMRLIEISICLLIIYAIIIRRQVDRIEEKIDAMSVERRADGFDDILE